MHCLKINGFEDFCIKRKLNLLQEFSTTQDFGGSGDKARLRVC